MCGELLALTRLACDECGTELSGHFPTCEYCSLGSDDRVTLRVFLASRGNMKEVERHLGVSYPTARARFDAILSKLGVEPASAEAPAEGPSGEGPEPVPAEERSAPMDVLDALARGDLDVDEALRRLG